MKKLLLSVLLILSTNCFAAEWQCAHKITLSCDIWRLEVFNGWIIKTSSYHLTSVYDPNHEWVVTEN